jgi:RHS repeat-associated protein
VALRGRFWSGHFILGRRGIRWRSLLAALISGVLVLSILEAPPAGAVTAPAAGEYVPVTQARIVDTRSGLGLPSLLSSGVTQSFQVTGVGGVPSGGVSAVVLTLTGVSPSTSSYVQVWAQGTAQPSNTTELFLNPGKTTANTAITKVGATGQVSVRMGSTGSTGTTHLLVDVQGYYTNSSATTTGTTFTALTPAVIYNTMSGVGGRSTPLGPGQTATVPVLGQRGVPSSGVAAVAVNVTSANATANTYLEVWSGATARPSASNVNVTAGQPAAALVQTAVASDGTISVYNSAGSTDVLIVVEGYYLSTSGDAASFFVPVTQTKILDTRSGLNTGGKTTPAQLGTVLSVPLRGVSVSGTVVVPASTQVSAVVLTVMAVNPTLGGYLAVYPEGEANPHTSVVNFSSSDVAMAGLVVAKVGSDGRASLYVHANAHVVVEVQGYFTAAPPAAPPAAGVSSAAFPANGWAASGTSGSVSLTMAPGTVPGVRQYRWALDDPSLAVPGVVNVASDNATGSISLSPADGWHTLYVQAANTANNTSPVITYTFGVGVGVTSPTNTARTTRFIRLDARGGPDYSGVTWRYRLAGADPWTAITPGQVTNAGTPVSAWPVTTTASGSSSVAPELVWDVSAGLGGVDGTVMLQACFTPAAGGALVCNIDASAPTITLDKIDAGGVDATTGLDVGSLDLLTGNVGLSAGDVQIASAGSALTVDRTFNTLDPAKTGDTASAQASVFGPGWSTGLPVESAGSSWTGLADRGSSVLVTNVDGVTTTFAKNTAGAWRPTGDDADSGLSLTAGTPGTFGPATWTVTDLDGNGTRFVPTVTLTHGPSAGNPNPYRVDQVTQPGSAQATTYTYDASGRPTHVLAPIPTGGICTGTTPSTWTGGCRALLLSYGTTGNETGRLVTVTYRTTDSSGGLLDVDVACYAYDSTARLAAAWDPRNGTAGAGSHPVACGTTQYRPTAYTYDADGRVATITPPGLAGYTLGYDGAGRLTSLSRTHNVANGGGTETTSIVYGIATDPDGSHPEWRPDLTTTAVAAWGQAEAPITATAVFGVGHTPGTDLRGATLYYLNPEGRTVNSAQYSGTGAAGWHIATTDYDNHGNTVRELTAANREEALHPEITPLALARPNDGNPDTTGDTAATAASMSTVNIYQYDTAGVGDLTDTFEPWHLTQLPDGTITGARAHTHISYDTGAELGHPAGGVLHLPTATTVAASLSQEPVATSETDIRTSTNDYALSSTDTTGWEFHQPMRTTNDPAGLHISTVTRYDPTTGAVIETRQPRSSGSDAGTTKTIYYTAGANSADAACGNKPAWATLTCVTTPAAQPGVAGLPGLVSKRISTYDYLARPTTVVATVSDAAGATQTRITTTSYSTGGYGTDTATTALTGGLGVGIPATTIGYDAATGLAITTSASATATQAATSQTTSYDDFGRGVSYTDNDAATGAQTNTTTTGYDAAGRVATITDAHGAFTVTYNQNGEYRDLPTTMSVSGAGDFTATYDPDGSLVTQTRPNGLTQTVGLDETGNTTSLTDTANGRTWYAETANASIHGQTTTDQYTGAGGYGGTRTYSYDMASRLTIARDTLSATGSCTTRTYTFDNDTNRKTNSVYGPAGDGSCQMSTPAAAISHSYDLADRLQPAGTDAGLAYDAFGRITAMPSADTGNNGGTATIGYYTNDLVRSQTQAGTTLTWTLDAAGRLATGINSTTSVAKTNHYDDPSSDSPTWIAENTNASNWTRNISDLTGALAATLDQGGTVTWQVTNLHGDVVATASNTDLEPASYYLNDEYGRSVGATQPGRYGWLGGQQRSQEDLAGLTLMGVRLYDSAIGRFASTDSIPGGNANSYDYCSGDALNCSDISGEAACFRTGTKKPWWSPFIYIHFRCQISDFEFHRLVDGLYGAAYGLGAAVVTLIAASALGCAEVCGPAAAVLAYLAAIIGFLGWIEDNYYKYHCGRRAGVHWNGNLTVTRWGHKPVYVAFSGWYCN